MKSLVIMPNFTVLADKKDPRYYEMDKSGIAGRLLSHGEKISNGTEADVFKITPERLWHGMNVDKGVDFIKFLQDNSDNIPDNVLMDLNKYASRFGSINLVGEDCLKVSNPDLLKEILNSTKIKEKIYDQDENLLFFTDISFSELQNLFIRELGYPIKVHNSKIKVYLIKLTETVSFSVKSYNHVEAFKQVYGMHDSINEESLRKMLKLKREIQEEDISKFMEAFRIEHKILVAPINDQNTLMPLRFFL